MTSLIRMRLAAFTRTGLALAPLLAGLVVLGTIYGGGQAQAGEAYGFSAAVLFPVVAWQAKILLDAEPDVQRRLAAVALGSPVRERVAGLVAALVPAVLLVALAIAVPWLVGGVTGPQRADDPTLAEGFVAGIWAHLLLIPPALALGALASRAATGNVARGLAVLAGGVVLSFVLSARSSPAPWLVPPVLGTGRATNQGLAVPAMLGYTGQALLWAAVAFAGYALLRRAKV